jgi:predicted DNA binding CopG/RHH family protein
MTEHAELFQLTVRIPYKLAERIKIRAVKDRLTLQELATRALEAYLKPHKEDA